MHEHHADPMKRLEKARAQLLKLAPFWAPILYRLTPELTGPAYPGFLATDGEKLRFNPHRCQKLTDPELVAGVAHEVIHILSEHHIRAHGKDPDTWNKAADYCVNLLLVEMFGDKSYPVRVPIERIHYDPRYEGMSAEAIYRELLNEQPPDEQPESEPEQDQDDGDEPQDDQDGQGSEEPENGQPENGQSEDNEDQDGDPDDGRQDEDGEGSDQEGEDPAASGGGDQQDGDPDDGRQDEDGEGNGEGEGTGGDGDEGEDQQDAHGGHGSAQGGEGYGEPAPMDFDPMGLGRIEPSPDPEEAKADLREKLAEIQVRAEALSIGDHIDSAVRRALERAEISFDWENALASYLFNATVSAGCDDFAWMRPNPHLLHSFDLIMPGTVRQDPPPFVIAIDTSGSMTDEQLAQIAGGITDLTRQYENLEIDVLYVDTAIRGRQRFQAGQPIELEPAGGGGTDFATLFAELAARPPEFLAFFTDLWVENFGPGASFPVLWIYTGDGEIPPRRPLFGKLTRLHP